MTELRTAHTADLDAATLDAARALLYQVLDNVIEHDWDHAQGGMHALVWERGELIGHASVVQRRLLHGGRALRPPTGLVRTEDDDGSIFVLAVSAALDISGPLVVDWRDGDVW